MAWYVLTDRMSNTTVCQHRRTHCAFTTCVYAIMAEYRLHSTLPFDAWHKSGLLPLPLSVTSAHMPWRVQPQVQIVRDFFFFLVRDAYPFKKNWRWENVTGLKIPGSVSSCVSHLRCITCSTWSILGKTGGRCTGHHTASHSSSPSPPWSTPREYIIYVQYCTFVSCTVEIAEGKIGKDWVLLEYEACKKVL